MPFFRVYTFCMFSFNVLPVLAVKQKITLKYNLVSERQIKWKIHAVLCLLLKIKCLVLGIRIILQEGHPWELVQEPHLCSCPAVLTSQWGTLKLPNLMGSTRLSRVSPVICLLDPLRWESVWIAEMLVEQVDVSLINGEECWKNYP